MDGLAESLGYLLDDLNLVKYRPSSDEIAGKEKVSGVPGGVLFPRRLLALP